MKLQKAIAAEPRIDIKNSATPLNSTSIHETTNTYMNRLC